MQGEITDIHGFIFIPYCVTICLCSVYHCILLLFLCVFDIIAVVKNKQNEC